MINSLLFDKSTWSALSLNSDRWLFSHPSEIPSGLCTLEIFQRIFIYDSLHKKILLQTVITSDIKSRLTEDYLPQTNFCHYYRPKKKENKEYHWCSTKPEFGLIPPRALHPVIATPYLPKATLETSTSSSVQKWALSHSSAITISTLCILGLNTRKRITVKLKEGVAQELEGLTSWSNKKVKLLIKQVWNWTSLWLWLYEEIG